MKEQIRMAYAEAGSYPQLVKKLVEIGVENYTVEVSTGMILYRFANGVHLLDRGHGVSRKVAENFDRNQTIQAVKNNQQRKTTYPQFMDEIALAGVKMYEATLKGKKRVTYIGAEDEYEEEIPV